jgi:6-phosphofructokinase 1
MSKLLIMHGGGPTAVLNSSLYGAICEAKESNKIDEIYASQSGVWGLFNNKLINLSNIPQSDLELLKSTPGSAIGTGRDHLEEEDYEKLAQIIADKGFSYVLMTGGNGTMDTAKKLSLRCIEKGIVVVGIPKTMDNDLSKTDHSPGFPSAARYLSGSIKEVAQDVKGLSIHVVIIEAFGRDAGWICASSALAREKKGDAPHLILCPEQAFDEAHFLKKVKEVYDKNGSAVVVASEGLRYKDGTPIVEPIFSVGRSVYFGDVSSHLAQLVTKKLGIKARSEKPGILSRASTMWSSDVDIEEAVLCGRKAVELALDNKNGFMPVILRTSTNPYSVEIKGFEIDDSIVEAKIMPSSFLDKENYDVTEDFIEWLSPLVEPKLQKYISFIDNE